MNQKMKKLVLTFYNENGDVVSELSKDPASINDVAAAINFLEPRQELRVASFHCDEKGNIID